MNYDEHEMVANNPFTLSTMATMIEAKVGSVMLKKEKRAGHVGRAPLSQSIGVSLEAQNPTNQTEKAIDLAAYLVKKPNMNRIELAKAFDCSKETIGRRTTNGIKMGLVLRIRTKAITRGQAMITYVAVNKGDDLTMTEE
jgi:hypothetical protein